MTPARTPAGFTLLEVMVTLFVISILMALVMPRLAIDQLEPARAAAMRMRNVLIWLRDQAASGNDEYRLRLIPGQGFYASEVLRGDTFVPVDDPLLQPTVIDPDQASLSWQPPPGETGGADETAIRFTPFGPERAILIRFATRAKGEGYTVSYRPEWGKPRLEAGLGAWE
ncbi:MAG: type II secretion system protein [Magnetococcales bacterium]|nr:type II secretion system protein [Magnetococcales bacterium]